jgi:formylglycine-generating enzyme required for sulfatase activity
VNPAPGDVVFLEEGAYRVGVDEADALRVIEAAAGGVHAAHVMSAVPAHEVRLAAAGISRRMVTISEFDEFVRESGYVTEAEADGWGWLYEGGRWLKKKGLSYKRPFGDEADRLYQGRREDMPLLQGSWNDALAYCRWLSGKYGRAVRLPLEGEWEVFARRLGAVAMHEAPPAEGRAAYSNDEYIRAVLEEIQENAASHRPGLLWEWCDDWFDVYPGGLPHREYGRVYKVLRGGSLLGLPLQRTAQYRFRRCPTARSPYYGFRIALV